MLLTAALMHWSAGLSKSPQHGADEVDEPVSRIIRSHDIANEKVACPMKTLHH
jgi:hypothetical protein